MASSVTTISTTNVLSTTATVLLNGPTKIVAKDMESADHVYIYEETGTEGDYQPVKDEKGNMARLDRRNPTWILDGYGNYKFLLDPATNESLVVGYVAAA